jgi:hypothetical protein
MTLGPVDGFGVEPDEQGTAASCADLASGDPKVDREAGTRSDLGSTKICRSFI